MSTRASDTFTHILRLAEDHELRISAHQGRIYIVVRKPKGRGQITTAIEADRFAYHADRLKELAVIAPTTSGGV